MKEFMKPTVSANVVIIDDSGNNLGRFQCSGAVLNEMFQSVKETEHYNMEEIDVSKLSRKLISQTLLLVKKTPFKFIKDENIITSMEVAK